MENVGLQEKKIFQQSNKILLANRSPEKMVVFSYVLSFRLLVDKH